MGTSIIKQHNNNYYIKSTAIHVFLVLIEAIILRMANNMYLTQNQEYNQNQILLI